MFNLMKLAPVKKMLEMKWTLGLIYTIAGYNFFPEWNVRNVYCARGDGHHYDPTNERYDVTISTSGRRMFWKISA